MSYESREAIAARTCHCRNQLHEPGCPSSTRRKDFFRPRPTVTTDVVQLTCLDCRRYSTAPDASEVRKARCRWCHDGGRMMVVPKK